MRKEGGGVALSAIARRFRQIKDFVFVGEVCTLVDVYFTAGVCSSWNLARSATVKKTKKNKRDATQKSDLTTSLHSAEEKKWNSPS